MRLFILLMALIAGAATGADAADLTVTVRDAAGKPVANAVVTVQPAGGVPKSALKTGARYAVTQQDIAFDPFVLVVPNGATVAFPNKDKVRHHVYSFSPAKKFELKLYGRDESRTVVFDNAGVVALGCNIHDRMTAYVKVVDTPWAAKTDAQGRVVLTGAPAGAGTLAVWHPHAKAKGGEVREAVSLTGTGASRTVTLPLKAAVHGH